MSLITECACVCGRAAVPRGALSVWLPRRARARRGKPCTLHPTPYTQHPIPYILHSTSYILHPTPYTLRAPRQSTVDRVNYAAFCEVRTATYSG